MKTEPYNRPIAFLDSLHGFVTADPAVGRLRLLTSQMAACQSICHLGLFERNGLSGAGQ
jgi:hypothetical protein